MICVSKCPGCGAKPGALTTKLHCLGPTCRWNRCQCGCTYDRGTGTGYRVTDTFSVFYPGPGKATP